MHKVITELTSVQINHLGTAPVSVAPAPGVGKAIIPIAASVQLNFDTIGFGEVFGVNPVCIFFSGATSKLNNGHSPPFIFGPFATLSYPTSTLSFGSSGIIGNGAGVFSSTFLSGSVDIPLSVVENKSLIFHSFTYNDDTAVDYSDYGSIVSSDVNVGGSGYSIGDTGIVGSSGGFASNNNLAEYVIDSVSGGVVTDFHLTNNGYGFKVGGSGATHTVTGGGDNNFSININSISSGNGTGRVIVIYDTVHI